MAEGVAVGAEYGVLWLVAASTCACSGNGSRFSTYRRRLIGRLDRRTVDEGYFDLRAAVGFYMRAAAAKTADDGECGAHVLGTPCYMPLSLVPDEAA